MMDQQTRRPNQTNTKQKTPGTVGHGTMGAAIGPAVIGKMAGMAAPIGQAMGGRRVTVLRARGATSGTKVPGSLAAKAIPDLQAIGSWASQV